MDAVPCDDGLEGTVLGDIPLNLWCEWQLGPQCVLGCCSNTLGFTLKIALNSSGKGCGVGGFEVFAVASSFKSLKRWKLHSLRACKLLQPYLI